MSSVGFLQSLNFPRSFAESGESAWSVLYFKQMSCFHCMKYLGMKLLNTSCLLNMLS